MQVHQRFHFVDVLLFLNFLPELTAERTRVATSHAWGAALPSGDSQDRDDIWRMAYFCNALSSNNDEFSLILLFLFVISVP